jgi:hypothetical protein
MLNAYVIGRAARAVAVALLFAASFVIVSEATDAALDVWRSLGDEP